MGVISIFIVYFLRLLRIYGGFFNFYENFDFLSMGRLVLEMIVEGDGELSLRKAFYHFIEHNNQFQDFNQGHTYIRLLLIAIPTSLSFGIKPDDFAIAMGSAWINNPYNTNYSMHPTLYGDVFANFWWWGVIAAFFWALFSFFIDHISERRSRTVTDVLYVVFASMYIIIARGSVYNGVFNAYISCLIIMTVYVISRIRIRRQ